MALHYSTTSIDHTSVNDRRAVLTNLQMKPDQAELPTGFLDGDDTPAVDGEVPVAQFITHTEVVV